MTVGFWWILYEVIIQIKWGISILILTVSLKHQHPSPCAFPFWPGATGSGHSGCSTVPCYKQGTAWSVADWEWTRLRRKCTRLSFKEIKSTVYCKKSEAQSASQLVGVKLQLSLISGNCFEFLFSHSWRPLLNAWHWSLVLLQDWTECRYGFSQALGRCGQRSRNSCYWLQSSIRTVQYIFKISITDFLAMKTGTRTEQGAEPIQCNYNYKWFQPQGLSINIHIKHICFATVFFRYVCKGLVSQWWWRSCASQEISQVLDVEDQRLPWSNGRDPFDSKIVIATSCGIYGSYKMDMFSGSLGFEAEIL